MATKTLTITEDAYERLAACKEEHESFSAVIKRVTGGHSLLNLVGVLSKNSAEELKKSVEETRKRWRTEVDR